VLVVVQSLNVGGMERVVVDLARGLAPDYATTVCCYDELGPLAEQLSPPATARLVARGEGFDRSLPGRLAELMRELDIDLVHAHNRTAFAYAALATRHNRIPLVYTEHGPTHPSSWKAKWLMRVSSWRKNRHFVAVAQWIRDLMVQDWRFPRRRVHLITNGVDAAAAQGPFSGPSLAEELGFDPAAPVVGIVAGLKPVKNHPLLLRAMRGVRAEHPDAQLVLVGDGPDAAALRELAAQLGSTEAVHFLGERTDIPRLVHGFDVSVLCSHSEGMSITLLEAMAAARPIVATRVGGTPDILEHDRSALLVPSGDEAALAAAISALLSDPRRAAALGAAARRDFDARFTLSQTVRRYAELYDTLLGQPTTR